MFSSENMLKNGKIYIWVKQDSVAIWRQHSSILTHRALYFFPNDLKYLSSDYGTHSTHNN